MSMTAVDELPAQIVVIDQTKDPILQTENQKCAVFLSQYTEIEYRHLEVASITAARNEGMRLAKNDVVVFSDDDIEVYRETFHNVYDIMKSEEVAIIGGHDNNIPLEHDTSIWSYIFGRVSYSKRKIGHVSPGVYGIFPSKLTEWTETEWAMGFFFVVRKSLAMRWALSFDENLLYYAYAEDLDFTYAYCRKGRVEGYKCGMSSLLSVNHKVSREYRVPKYSATMMEILHRYYILHKYDKALIARFLFWWCNIGIFLNRLIRKERPVDVLRAMRYLMANRKDVERGKFRYELYM